MKILNRLLILYACFLIGCAAYQELKPKPDINSRENGFIELKRDQKSFALKKGKKYFIQFPRATTASRSAKVDGRWVRVWLLKLLLKSSRV